LARKILLADDSVTAQNMGRKILADAGYEVITVNNGSAALKRVTESKPDLIVLDVYMPGYSGLEVCQRLKDAPDTAHIPVLLTVGKLEPFKPDEARRAQADGHIVKPFEASELLSALARLEDRIVPTDGPRFSTSVAGVERFGGDRGKAMPSDPDTGWKSRLRFPSKKKREEEEAAEEDAGANFRDFRKGKGKSGSNGTPAVSSAPPPGQEPGLVPDIPRDITPEELDALSALAAKLDGPIPAAENIASLAEKVGPATPPPGKTPPSVDPGLADVPAKRDAAGEVHAEAKTAGGTGSAMPVTAEPIKDFEVPAATAVGAPNAGQAEQGSGDGLKADAVAGGNPAEGAVVAVSEQTVKAAVFVEAPAPVDQQDEPMFAVAPASPSSEEKVEVKVADGIGVRATSPEPEAKASGEAVQRPSAQAFAVVSGPSISERSKDEQSVDKQAAAAAAKMDAHEETAQAGIVAAEANVPSEKASMAQQVAEAEVPAPTDEELAEALRLLTPSTGHNEVGRPSHETLVAAGQMLAEEAARTAGPNLRWVADAVALTQEESSLSLEEEMFRSFAGASATKLDSVPTNPVSAITAVVANRLAKVEQRKEFTNGMETPGSKADEIAAVADGDTVAGHRSLESGLGEKSAESATAAEQETEASMPSGTFADATLQKEEEQTPMAKSSEPVELESEAATADTGNKESSLEAEGEADVSKHGKEGSSKSGWHQIRKPASTSAASDVVEAAKQTDIDAGQEDSKAMAASATGEGGSSSPDASTIASIVDSVLADLRPKIVEEIAKKLGKK
jgi:CheY-like chemotaxis protein